MFIVVEEVEIGAWYRIEVVSAKVLEGVEPLLPQDGLVPAKSLKDFLACKSKTVPVCHD